MAATLTGEQIAQNLEEYIKQTCEKRAEVCLIALKPLLSALKTDSLTLKFDKGIVHHTDGGTHFGDLVRMLKEVMPEIENVTLLSASTPVEHPDWMTDEAYQALWKVILNNHLQVSSIDFGINSLLMENSDLFEREIAIVCDEAEHRLTALFETSLGGDEGIITSEICEQFTTIVLGAMNLAIIATQQDNLPLLLQSADWIWIGMHALPLGFKKGTKTVVCLVR